MTLLTAVTAQAQTPLSARPYRGLFGNEGSNAAESLTVNGSIGGGWDSNLVSDAGPGTPTVDEAPSSLRGAGYNSFSGSVIYQNSGRRVGFGASAATSGRYYRGLPNPFLAAHAAIIGLGYQISRSTSLNVSQSLSYQPFGYLNLFPVVSTSTPQPFDSVQVAAAPNLDMRANNADMYSTSSFIGINRVLSARSNLSGNYGYTRTKFGGTQEDFTAHAAAGRYTRQLTRNLSLRLGYAYNVVNYVSADEPYKYHQLDSGVDYNRVFSVSRRTRVGFDTGAAVVSSGGDNRFTVVGGAHAVHEIGRTWALSGVYSRNLQFIATLNEPLLSDSVTMSLGGMASRRVQANFGAGASTGNLGYATASNRLWTYYASSNISVAISRNLAIGSAYNFYHYSNDGGIYNVLGFVDELNRHSVSAYLSAWAPIFQKGR